MRHCVQQTFGLVLALAVGASAAAQAIHGREGITLPPPPAVEAIPVADDYFGTKILDSYRWLEDAKSPETQAFVEAQNAYTARYLKQARIRPQILDDLDALENVSAASIPLQRANNYFFSKRLAGEQQAAIYVRRGWTAKDEHLIDPAALSRDTNTSITLEDVSRDGTLVAYGVRKSGVDGTAIHVSNVKTGKTLEDELPAARYFDIHFAPDGTSMYYERNSKEGTLLYHHVLGARVSKDTLLFGREFRGELLTGDDIFSSVITDGHYLVVTIRRGVPARRVDIVYRDLSKPGSFFEVLVWGLDARFDAIHAQGAWYVKTDYQAPMGRILKADPGIMPDVWKIIVPEGQNAITDWSIVGGKLYVHRQNAAMTETAIYTLDGKAAGTVDSDGIGSSSAVVGRTTDRYGFYSFESLLAPPTVYRLDSLTGKREVFFQPKIDFDPSQDELKQVSYKSKDGTLIPMFIAGKKGLKRDGTERLLIADSGGSNLNRLPSWNPHYAWWLQQGGWVAMPLLRDSGEQGMPEQQQNGFDDFFAAAEYLIADKYTSPQHLAIAGASHRGLLMGTAIIQRPDLFSAVLCDDPLLDLLRYQQFSLGSRSMKEYGAAKNGKQFTYLLKLSPYHNVKPAKAYPAVLLFTGGEADMLPDPFHARKMTALLQAASNSGRPILLHVSQAEGQSGSTSLDQQIQDDADRLAFLWTETAQPAHGK
jgi:prolyl oligopeptidase